MVPLNESSGYRRLHLFEEINRDLLRQIQGTYKNDSRLQKFHLSSVHFIYKTFSCFRKREKLIKSNNNFIIKKKIVEGGWGPEFGTEE